MRWPDFFDLQIVELPQHSIDRFWKQFTSKWFTFLQWILVLTLIKFLPQETDSFALQVVYGISHLTVWMCLFTVFGTTVVTGFLPRRFARSQLVLSALISSGFLGATHIPINSIVSQLEGKI